ncbi:hypothetical protein [Embleya sp. NPDC059237]|uniref:hypothetical protein n=1 Tax=Embleya sp. NPDC059237 TaxID=3346784 RepID=UPI00369C4028
MNTTGILTFLAGIGTGMFIGALITLAARFALTRRSHCVDETIEARPGPVEAAEAILRNAARREGAP